MQPEMRIGAYKLVHFNASIKKCIRELLSYVKTKDNC